jgi:hypothetical protein
MRNVKIDANFEIGPFEVSEALVKYIAKQHAKPVSEVRHWFKYNCIPAKSLMRMTGCNISEINNYTYSGRLTKVFPFTYHPKDREKKGEGFVFIKFDEKSLNFIKRKLGFKGEV